VTLILTPLKRALAALDSGIVRALAVPEDDMLRDACIQRFEFTWELAQKLLRRKLEEVEASSAGLDQMAFKELIRLAAERGLVNDPLAWFAFREQRNRTVHTYDETQAKAVFSALPGFAVAARRLLEELEKP
jgi:nucleotidyltransferase substrate binding protein (TIGR01987 family)